MEQTPQQRSRLNVQVVALAANANFVRNLRVPLGQTVAWALNASGVRAQVPALAQAMVGIFGKRVAESQVLQEGDRVELYLPCRPAAVAAARQQQKARKNKETS